MVGSDNLAAGQSHSTPQPQASSSSSTTMTTPAAAAAAAAPPPPPPPRDPSSPPLSHGGNDGDSTATTTQHRESSRSQTPPTSPSSCEGGHKGKAKADSHSQSDPHANITPSYFYPQDPSDPNSHLDESAIPVFEPTMEQFADFYKFCEAIDSWGMKTGIVKVVPPKEWVDSLPSIRAPDVAKQEAATGAPSGSLPTLESVRIRSAIAQHFGPAFKPGLWRQTNICRPAKIWNVKQWSDVCREMSGPTMDGVKNLIKIRHEMESGTSAANAKDDKNGIRTRSGRGRQSAGGAAAGPSSSAAKKRRRVGEKVDKADKASDDEAAAAAAAAAILSQEGNGPSTPAETEDGSQPAGSAPSSSAPKVKAADLTTPEEWSQFDERLAWLKEWISNDAKQGGEEDAKEEEQTLKPKDWTPEACREIEGEYWRGLNFGKPPMYGADLKGTLFTPATKSWNVNSLDNLLTRLKLRRKIAGVTDPYLYFGMWRATFAWHVEDMDLYSINYVHFGAPKQWYAIPQRDRLRFETALASAFPGDARRCSQFMRHKSFLASPTFLAANNIRPLKLVQHAQEFVITYPFGYHSGYNLGFNCAESVNFALDSWVEIGRKAKACECQDAQQSVKMDVDALLQESEELEQAERRKEERERARREREELAQDDQLRKEAAKARRAEKKRLKEQRAAEAGDGDDEEAGAERKPKSKPKQAGLSLERLPCVFCPSSLAADTVPIPAQDGGPSDLAAHRFCANSVPECWVAPADDADESSPDEVKGFYTIAKARWGLKCSVCPPALAKYGCSIQCTYGTCTKAAHPTCAAHDASGWMMDMLSANEADKMEGRGAYGKSKKGGPKKKAAGAAGSPSDDSSQPSSDPIMPETSTAPEPSSSTSSDNAPERMVVLCRGHNPSAKQAEQLRRARHLRECALRLLPGSRIKIKSNGGIWETTLVALKVASNELAEGDALVDDAKGPRRVIKWSRIVFDPEIVAAASQATEEQERQEHEHHQQQHAHQHHQQQAQYHNVDSHGDAIMSQAPFAPMDPPLPPRSRLLNDAEFAMAKADRFSYPSAAASVGRLLGGAAPAGHHLAQPRTPQAQATNGLDRHTRASTAPIDAHLSSARVTIGSAALSTINRPSTGAVAAHPYAATKGAGYGYGTSSFGHHSLVPKTLKRLPAVMPPVKPAAPPSAPVAVPSYKLAPPPTQPQQQTRPAAPTASGSGSEALPLMSSMLPPPRSIAPMPRGGGGAASSSHTMPPPAPAPTPGAHPSYSSYHAPSYSTSGSAGAPYYPHNHAPLPASSSRYDPLSSARSAPVYHQPQHQHQPLHHTCGSTAPPPTLPPMTRPYYSMGPPLPTAPYAPHGSASRPVGAGIRPSYETSSSHLLPRLHSRDEPAPPSSSSSSISSGRTSSLTPSYHRHGAAPSSTTLPPLPPPQPQPWLHPLYQGQHQQYHHHHNHAPYPMHHQAPPYYSSTSSYAHTHAAPPAPAYSRGSDEATGTAAASLRWGEDPAYARRYAPAPGAADSPKMAAAAPGLPYASSASPSSYHPQHGAAGSTAAAAAEPSQFHPPRVERGP